MVKAEGNQLGVRSEEVGVNASGTQNPLATRLSLRGLNPTAIDIKPLRGSDRTLRVTFLFYITITQRQFVRFSPVVPATLTALVPVGEADIDC